MPVGKGIGNHQVGFGKKTATSRKKYAGQIADHLLGSGMTAGNILHTLGDVADIALPFLGLGVKKPAVRKPAVRKTTVRKTATKKKAPAKKKTVVHRKTMRGGMMSDLFE